MKFLLDSSTCIAHLRGRSAAITSRLAAAGAEAVLCSPVVHELVYGVERSRNPARELPSLEPFLSGYPSLPFDNSAGGRAQPGHSA